MNLLTCLCLLLALAGCASGGNEQYRIGSSEQRHANAAAAQAFAESVASVPTSANLDRPLKVLASPMPAYPQAWRNANVTGKVQVDFTIEPSGAVSNPAVVGSPPAPLAAIVLESILRWRFEPPLRDGKAVPIRARQVFSFATE